MKISIITASYNYEQYIKETIESVLNQIYSDWEMIIVDDGSSDSSVEIINSYVEKDPRIKLFTHENNENKGLKETIKLGLSKTNADWVVFLESDDILRSDYLEKKIKIIKTKPDAALIFNDCEFFGDEARVNDFNKIFSRTRNWLKKQEYPKKFFYNFFSTNKIFTFSCVMCKKSAFKQVDFNTPIDPLLDWWLWIQLAYNNKFYYTDEQLSGWRLHSNSYIQESRRISPLDLEFKAYMNICRRYNDYKIIPFLIYASIKWVLCVIKKYTIPLIRKIWK